MIMISDLIGLAAAGGGMRVNCQGKMISDLVRIAAAASGKKAILILENTKTIMVSDKIKIAAAGQGCVFFNDEV
jgi:DNA replication protein